MPKLLVNHSDIREAFAHLMRSAENTNMYGNLTGSQRISDISADAQCVLAPGYRLIRVDHRMRPTSDEFEIALVNDIEHSVVYYNRVVISAIADLNCRPATQNLVWRSPNAQHAAVLRDVAHKVFFNYVLERYDVILSDNQQTGEGKFFWQRQMSNALAFGLHVYYYQMMTALLQPILTQDDLNNLEDQLWSEHDDQQYHLALISKVELPAALLITNAGEA
ncbi:hypothetical protein CXQ81_04145 [Pseudomonas sp. 09C 129]|uniref:hypothetical protein n=1 Tax=Pseudomonas sp. 09C 129 TaxID=2054915 RepID=UPI000C6E4005|nr:hypothetical protein [Pseudomonas sp. 09C 129]AUF99813.1 hypothetical protein CXQ81_04145 [Pseudomonas sp. 09C 129]